MSNKDWLSLNVISNPVYGITTNEATFRAIVASGSSDDIKKLLPHYYTTCFLPLSDIKNIIQNIIKSYDNNNILTGSQINLLKEKGFNISKYIRHIPID
jgi:hypothetical protein